MSDTFHETFKKAISKVVVKHGQAYDLKEVWGDTRGSHDWEAEEHMKTCSPVKMEGYEEEYSWNISNTFHSENFVGVRAIITCECGKVTEMPFLLENCSLGTLLGWLLEDDQ